MSDFGDQLRTARKRRGMSQADLAAGLGVTPPTVYLWEHEKMRPKLKMIARLVSVLTLSNEEAEKFYIAAGYQPPSSTSMKGILSSLEDFNAELFKIKANPPKEVPDLHDLVAFEGVVRYVIHSISCLVTSVASQIPPPTRDKLHELASFLEKASDAELEDLIAASDFLHARGRRRERELDRPSS